MYVINGHEVLSEKRVVTNQQQAVVKQHHCMLRRIVASAAETDLAPDEPTVVTLQWQLFDLAAEQYVDEDNTAPITVDVAGTQDVLEPVGGAVQFEFLSSEPGEFAIRTLDELVDNAELVVTVNETA